MFDRCRPTCRLVVLVLDVDRAGQVQLVVLCLDLVQFSRNEIICLVVLVRGALPEGGR